MDWNSSALWGLIGLVGGLIISSFFFYIGLKRKSLLYDITTTTLVSNNASQIRDLSIKYRDKQINNLYTSTIRIKNNGNTIIEPTDFAPSTPLMLITSGEFLVYSDTGTRLSTENDSNNVYPLIEISDNNMCKKTIIKFDYIAKKEVILCTVFHTGSISITGKLKDGKLKSSEVENKMSHIKACVISVIITVFLGIIAGLLTTYFHI